MKKDIENKNEVDGEELENVEERKLLKRRNKIAYEERVEKRGRKRNTPPSQISLREKSTARQIIDVLLIIMSPIN